MLMLLHKALAVNRNVVAFSEIEPGFVWCISKDLGVKK